MTDDDGSMIGGETCPACLKKTLTLTEREQEIPYFGKAFMYSMSCENPDCSYHLSDVELSESGTPIKAEFEISSEDDMNVRVVKSSSATVKLPRIMTIEPAAASSGYITNIEGMLSRVKRMLETTRDASEDKTEIKKCKNMIKKLQSIMWGQDTIKLTIEDPAGNSAIISDKTKITKGKTKTTK